MTSRQAFSFLWKIDLLLVRLTKRCPVLWTKGVFKFQISSKSHKRSFKFYSKYFFPSCIKPRGHVRSEATQYDLEDFAIIFFPGWNDFRPMPFCENIDNFAVLAKNGALSTRTGACLTAKCQEIDRIALFYEKFAPGRSLSSDIFLSESIQWN